MAPLCLYFYIHISSLVFKIFWSYSRCIFINKNFQQKGKQNRAGECMKPYTALLNSPPKSTTYMWNMCTTHDFLILISIRTHICSSAWIPNPKEYVYPTHPSIYHPTHPPTLTISHRTTNLYPFRHPLLDKHLYFIWFITNFSTTVSNNCVSTSPTRSCNNSSTITCLFWNKKNTRGKVLTGPSLISVWTCWPVLIWLKRFVSSYLQKKNWKRVSNKTGRKLWNATNLKKPREPLRNPSANELCIYCLEWNISLFLYNFKSIHFLSHDEFVVKNILKNAQLHLVSTIIMKNNIVVLSRHVSYRYVWIRRLVMNSKESNCN